MNEILTNQGLLSEVPPAIPKQEIITKENVAYYADKMAKWIYGNVVGAKRKGVILGMSGGVDCSVVARLCQLGNVETHLVSLPYGTSMNQAENSSINRAREFADKFGFRLRTFNIADTVMSMLIDPYEVYDEKDCRSKYAQQFSLAEANVCARIRMNYLYQMAQVMGCFVIGTGNLSERFTGYFTKWGDGACDLNPLGWCTKREVYILAEYLEVPASIINEKPSADLWDGQSDESELGFSYECLDEYLIGAGLGDEIWPGVVEKIITRNQMSKHKLYPIPIFKLHKNITL